MLTSLIFCFLNWSRYPLDRRVFKGRAVKISEEIIRSTRLSRAGIRYCFPSFSWETVKTIRNFCAENHLASTQLESLSSTCWLFSQCYLLLLTRVTRRRTRATSIQLKSNEKEEKQKKKNKINAYYKLRRRRRRAPFTYVLESKGALDALYDYNIMWYRRV